MFNQSENHNEVNNDEFSEILKSNDIVVANFFADWHMSCLMLTPIIEDMAIHIKKARFVSINLEDNETLKEKHKISSMPCVIMFNKGKEIERITGSRACDIVEEKIKNKISCCH